MIYVIAYFRRIIKTQYLISKVLPKLEGRKVNQEIMKFNWEVENHYIDNERVCFSANDNFAKSSSIVERRFRGGNDAVHLSNEGIRAFYPAT